MKMENYERKLKKIKKSIKNIVVENSALCDDIASVQNKIDITKMEREFLLRKLFEYEPSSLEIFHQQQQQSLTQSEPTKYKKRKNSDTNSEASSSVNSKPAVIRRKLLKPTVGVRLPLIISSEGITLLNYGKIIFDRPAYHTESVIYPVGYKISRVFSGTNYICSITESTDNRNYPHFEIYKEVDPAVRFVGSTSDDAHSELLQAFESSSIIMPDGDRFFGLRNKNILENLCLLPNVKKLVKFNKKRESLLFDESAKVSSLSDHIF